MKQLVVVLLLGLIVLSGCKPQSNGQNPGGTKEGLVVMAPCKHKVVVAYSPFGPKVAPGTLVVSRGDTVRFVAVDRQFTVTLQFAKASGEISTKNGTLQTFTWIVPADQKPGYYTYEVTDTANGLMAAGNSAPVIIIDPE